MTYTMWHSSTETTGWHTRLTVQSTRVQIPAPANSCGVNIFSLCLGGFPLSTAVSSHIPKTCTKRGDLKARGDCSSITGHPARSIPGTYCHQTTSVFFSLRYRTEAMKVVFVFVLLFAAVLCRPARKYSDSSAESSEEMVRRPAASLFRKKMADLTRFRVSPFRLFQKFLAPIALGSDEITAGSDEAAVEIPALVNFETPDEAATDTPSVDNQDEPSKDGDDEDDEDDEDDDEDESEESESEEEDEEDSSESGESSTVAPETVTPVIVTEEPLLPTIVTDTDSGRGDSMGAYPSEYKSYVYAEEKTYHKAPSSYKSYEYVDSGKKSGYDVPIDNEVEKSPEVYKSETYQEHTDMLEEDTSTPENQDALPAEEETDGTSDSGSSADAEEEEQSEPEQSSEETTATPGAADSDSDESDSMESDSDEHETARETTDMPVVITAK